MEAAVSLAEQFATLPIVDGPFRRFDTAPVDTEKAPARSRTVYSVGEAIQRREQSTNAELGASPREYKRDAELRNSAVDAVDMVRGVP